MIVHCKICGKPVEVKSPNVKYCDECRRKKYETTYRIKGEEEAIKYAYQKRIEQMRAKRNGPSIEEVVREANKEGLSYGQKDPEVCIFRQTADKYVERRIKKDEMR